MRLSCSSIKLPMVLTALALPVLLGGCVGDERSAEERWGNELFLVVGELKEREADAMEAAESVDSRQGLRQVFMQYEATLTEQLKKVEGIDPPQKCANEHDAVEELLGEMIAATATLASSDLSVELLQRVEAEYLESRSAYVRVTRSMRKNGTC